MATRFAQTKWQADDHKRRKRETTARLSHQFANLTNEM